MAQFGSAQREPSMEEILASIRRIIEDSDNARKADEGVSDRTSDAGEGAFRQQSRPETAATVIEVEAFRSEARSRVTPVETANEAVSETAAAETAGADAQDDDIRAETVHTELFRPVALRAGTDASSRPVPSADEWRLGVPPQSSEPAAPDSIDEAIVSAVMQDVAEAAAHAAASVSAPTIAISEAETHAEAPPVLLSDAAEKQVSAAFNELNEALAARNRRNLDEMAEALLRPMLQEWLDNNLPTLVEKLVRQEIERVARGT